MNAVNVSGEKPELPLVPEHNCEQVEELKITGRTCSLTSWAVAFRLINVNEGKTGFISLGRAGERFTGRKRVDVHAKPSVTCSKKRSEKKTMLPPDVKL